MKTGSLRILHLSDVHFGQTIRSNTQWRLRRVLGEAWKHNLDEIAADGQPDIVCFTGDIAFSGQATEYVEASAFFDQLLTHLDVPKSRLFVVPGNHDVDRKVKKNVWTKVRNAIQQTTPEKVAQWMAGGAPPLGFQAAWRDALLARQAKYREWLVAYGLDHCMPGSAGQRHPHLGYRATLNDWAQPLHVIGLDSAWLAGDDHDAEKLRVTDEQIGRHLTHTDGSPLVGVRLFLLHHPISTLADGKQARGALLHHRPHLVLHGHVHDPDFGRWQPSDSADAAPPEFAGCLYEWDTFPNGFQLLDLALPATGEATLAQVWLRSWTPRGKGRWINDNAALVGADNGRWRPMPASAAPSKLPEGGCIGRDTLLAELRAHLIDRAPSSTAPRCAVLTGMPGVGKSRLAHTFVRDHWAASGGAPSPTSFTRLTLGPTDCDDATSGLTAIPAATTLAQRVAATLRLNAPASAVVAALAHELAHTQRLLLIENVDTCAQANAVGALVSRLPGCVVLITARQRDWHPAFHTSPVPPLSVDDSVQLVKAEVGTTRANALTNDELRWLARQLGNLPLALHIAAAHLRRGYSVHGFVDELKAKGFTAEPTPGDAGLADDVARAILEPSFRLAWEQWQKSGLPPASVDALLPLAHAPAEGVGASLGAALCGLNDSDFERMRVKAGLHSLLETEDDIAPDRSRFHPLLAEWLRTHCAADPVALGTTTLGRLAAWFCQRLPEGDDQGVRWAEASAEPSALRQLLQTCDHATAIRVERAGTNYAVRVGPFALWAAFCERHQATAEPQAQNNFLWTLTQTARNAGDVEHALTAARAKWTLDHSRGDDREAALARGAEADILEARGQLDQALAIRENDELPVYERLGDVRSAAVTKGKIADILQARGQLDQALAIRENDQLPVYERLGDVRSAAVCKANIAGIYLRLGRLDDAERVLQHEALLVFERIGYTQEAEQVREMLAAIKRLRNANR